jgi:hypothetical protein
VDLENGPNGALIIVSYTRDIGTDRAHQPHDIDARLADVSPRRWD